MLSCRVVILIGLTNPIALRKAKIVYKFGLSECNRVKFSVYVLKFSREGRAWELLERGVFVFVFFFSEMLTLEEPITTAADDLHKYFSLVFRENKT